MRIADTFQINDRGLGVAVAQTTDLPVAKRLAATVIRPDGTVMEVDAFKERLVRRTPEPVGVEAFLLMGLSKTDVPIGSELRLTIVD